MAVHVWQLAKPKYPYDAKEIGLTTVQAGLDEVKTQGVHTLIVHGDCPPVRCTHTENIRVPVSGIDIIGVGLPILSGAGAGRTVAFLKDQKPVTTVSGFEVISGAETLGAGLYAKDSAVVVQGCCIHDNTAADRGGGIFIEYTSEDAEQRQSTIANNWIYKNNAKHGAGVGVRGVSLPEGLLLAGPLTPAVFIRSNLIGPDNVIAGATFGYGAGVLIYRIAALVEGNEIKLNRAKRTGEANGGGICIHNFDENDAALSYVPAIGRLMAKPWELRQVQVQLKQNWIHDNTSESAGGGVAALWEAVVELTGNVVEKNIAFGNGAGAYGTVGTLLIFGESNKIYDNDATGADRAPDSGKGGGLRLSCRSRAEFSGPNLVSTNHCMRDGAGISVHNSELFALETLALTDNEARTGMGGGLCAEDYAEADRNFRPCDAMCEIEISDAIVESNVSKQSGGGIAVIQSDVGIALTTLPVKIERTVIRSNKSASQIEGVLVRRSPKASSPASDAYAARNLFSDNTVADVLLSADVRVPVVMHNELDGINRDARGLSVWIAPGVALGIQLGYNNIVNHTTFGLASYTAVHAWANWWGNAGGPTLPGAAKLGDAITQNVNPKPFETARLAFTAPAIPAPLMPNPSGVGSPSVPDCPAGKPLTTIGVPEQPQIQTPRGTGISLDPLRFSLLLPNGAVERALILATGDAVLLGPGGAARAFMHVDGTLYPVAFQPPLRAEEPVPPPLLPPAQSFEYAAELADNIAAAVAYRISPSGDYARLADSLATFTDRTGERRLPTTAYLKASAEEQVRAAIEVDSWPVVQLVSTGALNSGAFDWRNLVITVSNEGRSVGYHSSPLIASHWQTDLLLPLPSDWFTAETPQLTVLFSPGLGRQDNIPWPLPPELCEPVESRLEVLDLSENVSAVRIPAAQPGTWHLRIGPP